MKNVPFLALCCIGLSLPASCKVRSVTPKPGVTPGLKSPTTRPKFVASAQSAAAVNGNYLKNSDFENTGPGGVLAGWQLSGGVEPEAVSGAWKKLTAKFRSGKETTVGFFINIPRGASGSIWIDDVKVGPDIALKNAGFEETDDKVAAAGWNEIKLQNTVFSDTSRVFEGKRSLRITHAHEAVPQTMVWQDIAVEPNKEYTISFEMFVGDDFQGEAKGWLFNAAHATSLDFDYENMLASTIVEERDRLGRFAAALTPVAGKPAMISQDVIVRANSNLYSGLDLDNSAFRGRVQFVVEDSATGRVLHQTEVGESQKKWQTVHFSLQNEASKVRVKVVATGEGSVRIDNLSLKSPQVIPALQQVDWLPAAENFCIPPVLGISVQGEAGAIIDGGLSLLAKDLKPFGIQVKKQNSGEAPVQLLIGAAYGIKGRGDEAYSLAVNSKCVVIKAATKAGAFYGLMTLLQLIDSREGKPVFLPCKVTDYPDMPMRGFLYADNEQAARWKMNTMMVSTGYPVTPAEKQDIRKVAEQCASLNLDFIPMFMSLQGGYYVQKINPNLAAGVAVKDEKIILAGTDPVRLANPYVIRTGLTDVKLKSTTGVEYTLGTDYAATDGEMTYNYDNPNAKPFTVARLPGSSIPDGATVLASYDWVSHVRKRRDLHLPYVNLEPEVQKLNADFLREFAREGNYTYINSLADLMEFDIPAHMLETDSRVIKSGKTPIDLLVEDAHLQVAAIKEGNPKTRVLQWAGVTNDFVKDAAPRLPKDALVNIWGYDAAWPISYGREAVEYWTKQGFETSVMPWDNMRNIDGWAQVVMEARRKGYPCKGIIGSGWEGRPGGFKETALVMWKVPRPGDKSFVALPAEGKTFLK